MRFVIVGAGAVGSIYAAYLARSGHEVSLIARGDRAHRLARHGVSVGGHEAFSVRCDIVTDPQWLGAADVVIVAVKTYDTETAIAPLANLRPECAFSVQNGVLKHEQLRRVFGEAATLGAVSMLGGAVGPPDDDRPGLVEFTMPGATTIGELAGGASGRVRAVVAALEGAGLAAVASSEIRTVEWSKFVAWSGVSAVATLTRWPTHRFLSDPDTARIAARIMRETANVAGALGIALADTPPMLARSATLGSEGDAVRVLQAAGERLRQSAPAFRQSMLQDAERGRRLEVDETLGHTLQLATELGVATPTVEVCTRVLRGLSRGVVGGLSDVAPPHR